MDFFDRPSLEIMSRALDGLSARHNALLDNIANAETPDYKRVDVKFEDQLSTMIKQSEAEENIKMENSKDQNVTGLVFIPNSLMPNDITTDDSTSLIKVNVTNDIDFKPEIITDEKTPSAKDNGNNVNIEAEMVELAKNGTKYEALATLEQKMFSGTTDIIKGTS